MPIADPSFLAVDSRRRFLYSVSEEGGGGSVTAFRDRGTTAGWTG